MGSTTVMDFVLVSGDFTPWGGMDRPNYELALHLAENSQARVHLVSHNVADPLATHPNVSWTRVRKPLGRHVLASPLLNYAGRRVAQTLAAGDSRVIVNGGNCNWSDVNWVHAVHAAWDNRCDHASASFRFRVAAGKVLARRSERRALLQARLVMTNSNAARQQIVDRIGIPANRVHTVYYGIDSDAFGWVSVDGQMEARRRLNWPTNRPVVAFVGALGHDRNKGFDILFAAWEKLCADRAWDVDLVAAGGGAEVSLWQNRAAKAGLEHRIRLLGFTKNISDVLSAADALVSPTHYDAYGQGVHEAICRGIPAFVTRTAGIAERFPSDLEVLLLESPPNEIDVTSRLRHWRRRMTEYRDRVRPFSDCLRLRTWRHMAEDILRLLQCDPIHTDRSAA